MTRDRSHWSYRSYWSHRAASLKAKQVKVQRIKLAAAFVAAGLTAVGAAGCGSSSVEAAAGASQYKPITIVTRTAPPTNWPYFGTRVEPPLPKPAWTLTDTTGAAYDIGARTRGKITVLFFGFTSCADDCPTMMADMAAALRAVSPAVRDQVTVLFVTVDPAHDTGPVLRAWLNKFYPTFVGLTASDATVIKDASELGIKVSLPVKVDGVDSVQHGTESEVFNASGYANFFWGPSTPVLDIAHDLNEITS
jgi:protein SCO1